jgi:hypothetical protein
MDIHSSRLAFVMAWQAGARYVAPFGKRRLPLLDWNIEIEVIGPFPA